MLKIYEESLYQDRRIKALFTNSKRYNKEKKTKYENHLRKLGYIVYNERFLNCNANKTYPKTFRLKCSYKSPSIGGGVQYRYRRIISKNLFSKVIIQSNKPYSNHYRMVNLPYLNQKVSIHIKEDNFFYDIETVLELPYYPKGTRYSIKKQIDWHFEKLLREGKLAPMKISKKIIKTIERNRFKLNSNKGDISFLYYIHEKEKANYIFEIRNLDFNKTEIPFFHNVRIMVNGKMVILTRDINDLMVNRSFNSNLEVFETFLNIGLHAIGIEKREVTSLEIVSFEIANMLNSFDKTKHRDTPVLKYGKCNQKRDLGYIGFENWYDYIDFSSIDDFGEPIPEYEIQYINRKNRTIPDIIRDLDFLLPFDANEPIIESFDITASNEPDRQSQNDFTNVEKIIYKSNQNYDLKELAYYISYRI